MVYCILLSCHIIEIMFMALRPQHHLAFNQPQKQFIALYTLPPWPLSLKSLLLCNIRGNKWLLRLVKCGTEAKVCFVACIIQTNIDYSFYMSLGVERNKRPSSLSEKRRALLVTVQTFQVARMCTVAWPLGGLPWDFQPWSYRCWQLELRFVPVYLHASVR